MANRISIRPAEEGDLEIVGRICVDAYQAAGQLDDEPHQGYGAVLADTRPRLRDAVLLVATLEREIVGTVTVCPPGSPFSEIAREGEIEFRFLSVAPHSWGMGAGGALIDACETYARESSADRVVICVRDTNTAAMDVYKRRGYVRMPDRDWEPVPEVTLLALHKPL